MGRGGKSRGGEAGEGNICVYCTTGLLGPRKKLGREARGAGRRSSGGKEGSQKKRETKMVLDAYAVGCFF